MLLNPQMKWGDLAGPWTLVTVRAIDYARERLRMRTDAPLCEAVAELRRRLAASEAVKELVRLSPQKRPGTRILEGGRISLSGARYVIQATVDAFVLQGPPYRKARSAEWASRPARRTDCQGALGAAPARTDRAS